MYRVWFMIVVVESGISLWPIHSIGSYRMRINMMNSVTNPIKLEISTLITVKTESYRTLEDLCPSKSGPYFCNGNKLFIIQHICMSQINHLVQNMLNFIFVINRLKLCAYWISKPRPQPVQVRNPQNVEKAFCGNTPIYEHIHTDTNCIFAKK